jgi:hypothetical protein
MKVTGTASALVALAAAMAKAAVEIVRSLVMDVTLCLPSRNRRAESEALFFEARHVPPAATFLSELGGRVLPFGRHRAYFSGASP